MIWLPTRGRIVIGGGPGVGKSHLARTRLSHGFRVRATDELRRTHKWGDDSAEVARWFDEDGPWVVEGVTTARALRKWLAAHPDGAPCDVVAWLSEPREERSKGQVSMAKGCETVWAEVWPELLRRGVEVQHQR